MIISISGYSGSGKDTVCKLIQYALTGRKDYSVQAIVEDYPDHEWWMIEQSGYQRKAWADKLKQVASLLTGTPVEKFQDQAFKQTLLPEQWDQYYAGGHWVPAEELQDHALPDGTPTYRRHQMTVREFIQRLGTDAIRYGLHPDTWVNALMNDYVPAPFYTELPNWIITDTRFSNEYQAIKDRQGIFIRIDRPGVDPVNPHESETALDGYPFRHVITNDGTLEDLYRKVEAVVTYIKTENR